MTRKCFLLGTLLVSLTSAILAQVEVPKFEIGAQYSARGVMGTTSGCGGCGVIASGAGARFIYNPFRFVSLEGEWNIYPHASGASASNLHGGTPTAASFGAKAGWRNNKFGVFAKVAPGYLSYSHAITSAAGSGVFTYGAVTHFSQYFGGVAEYYPVRHIAVRVDVGQTLTRYHADFGSVSVNDWKRDGQVEAGMSYRF